MKKLIAILLAGMMAATALVGCTGNGETSSSGGEASGDGSSQSSELKIEGSIVDESLFGKEGADGKTITLKVWAPDASTATFKSQIEDFKKAYPNKTFDITVVAQGEGDAATQVLNDATVAADIFSFPSDQLNKLVEAGVILPAAFKDAVTERDSEATVKAGTLNGELYAYPETNDNGYYLVYDKRVVSDEQAKTFEGVLEACKTAGKKFTMNAGDGFYACTFAFTGGVKIDGLEEDGVTQIFTDYDEDFAVKTLQAFGNLFKKYKGTFQSLSVDNVSSGFSNGTGGAGIDGSWDTATNKKYLGDNFGAAKLPTINVDGTDTQLVSMFGYKYIGVNGSSKFPASAQILAFYLTGEECQRQRAEELGWGPSNNKVAAEAVVTESPVLTAIKEQAENACPQVNISSTFWDPMGNLGNKLIAEDADLTDAAIRKLLQDTIKNVRDEA